MLSTLSNADERRIMSALDRVIGDDHDDDPDAALAKAAEAAQVPLGHVPLMVRAYNTARSAWQREHGSDVLAKSAEFPLAHAGRVLAAICPDEATKAAAVSPEYALPPVWYDRPAKNAAMGAWILQCRSIGPRDETAEFHKAAAAARRKLAAAGEDRLPVTAARSRVEGAVAKLAAAFRQPGVPSFLDVKLNAGTLHGPAGEAAMDFLARTDPKYVKLAVERPYHATTDCPAIYAALAELVKAGHELKDRFAELPAMTAAREKRAVDMLAPWADQIAPPQPAGPSLFDAAPAQAAPPEFGAMPEANPIQPLSIFDDAPQHERTALGMGGAMPHMEGPPGFDQSFGPPKLAAGIPAAVGIGLAINKSRDMLDSLISSSRSYSDPANKAQKVLGSLADPDHEAALSDIRTRAALSAMISHDPALRSYDPRELSRAFNEVSDIAPGLASKPLLARPLLRKYLSMGHLDSFDGSEVVKTEKGLRENKAPASPSDKPKSDDDGEKKRP